MKIQNSYRQIFKSTSIIGGTQAIKIVIGIVRTKALAVLLGPAGMGLAGMYQSATSLIGIISGLGIGSSGVRQIAESAGTGDSERISRTIAVLRWVSRLTGIIGMLAVLILAIPIAKTTFGDAKYASGVALVSLTLLFAGISTGQLALLQGLRRLKDLAAANLIGSLLGTLATLAIVYFLRERGVALFLVVLAALEILTSWWFARRVEIAKIKLSWMEMRNELRSLIRMGVAFMVTGILGAAIAYVVRVIIIREIGMDAVGLYTAIWTLSSFYVGIVLNAMGTDFYPRLTAAAEDNRMVNSLVNEQTEMALLIALPGILAMIVFAPLLLKIFYSAAFVSATNVLRWQTLAVGLRVILWPIGFIYFAKGMAKMILTVETTLSLLELLIVFLCIKKWGLTGTGIGLTIVYSIALLVSPFIAYKVTGFTWSRRSIYLVTLCVISMVMIMVVETLLPPAMATGTGIAILIIVGGLCLAGLRETLSIGSLSQIWVHLRMRIYGRDL